MKRHNWRWMRTTFAPRTLHLPEIIRDLGPMVGPIIFQEPARLIAIIVESPWHKRIVSPVADEVRLIRAGPNPPQRLVPRQNHGIVRPSRQAGPGEENENTNEALNAICHFAFALVYRFNQ